MRKLALVLMILAVFTVGAAPALAQPSEGAFALATYLPDDIDAYIGLRTDDQAIADLDGLLGKISSFAAEFGAEGIPSNLRDLLLQMTDITPDDIDAVQAWLGDVIAFGTTDTPDRPESVVWVVTLDDRAAAEAFIMSRIGDQFEQTGTQGDFTVYEGDGYLLFSDDVLLGISEATPNKFTALTSGDYPRLSDNSGFMEAVSSLPSENYMLGLYASEDIAGELNTGLDGMTGNAAVGLGVLDGTTLAIDVFSPITGIVEGDPIDPAFARHIPADSNFFFHGSNIGGLIDANMDELSRQQAQQAMTSAGLDLDSVLEWMSGDFAVYSRLDFTTFWQSIMTGIPADSSMQDVADGVDVGFVIEATDPEAAAQFTQALGTLLRSLPIEEPGKRVETQETLAGTDATVFTITAADDTGITFRVALASNDKVFAIGTYNGVAASLTGDPGISGSALASEAAAYFLPDASAVWFIDGQILSGASSVALLVFIGPAIQDVFDNITDTLNGTPAASVTPTPVPDLMASLDFNTLMARLSQFLRYATASVSAREDGALVRITLTLGQ